MFLSPFLSLQNQLNKHTNNAILKWHLGFASEQSKGAAGIRRKRDRPCVSTTVKMGDEYVNIIQCYVQLVFFIIKNIVSYKKSNSTG